MSYLGSKAASGAYQAIIALMPPHETYIETHLGSGAVLKRKPISQKSYGIDIDPQVIRQGDFPNAELLCCDSIAFLESFDFSTAGRTLIYSDPPYLPSTRGKARYRFDYSEEDHIRLLACLKNIPAAVILSGYPSDLYDDHLSTWFTKSFQVMSRGGVRTEKLWFNYEFTHCHWSAFAGENFTDRQRIKRKAQRWAEKYRLLSSHEQIAVLSAILDVHK